MSYKPTATVGPTVSGSLGVAMSYSSSSTVSKPVLNNSFSSNVVNNNPIPNDVQQLADQLAKQKFLAKKREAESVNYSVAGAVSQQISSLNSTFNSKQAMPGSPARSNSIDSPVSSASSRLNAEAKEFVPSFAVSKMNLASGSVNVGISKKPPVVLVDSTYSPINSEISFNSEMYQQGDFDDDVAPPGAINLRRNTLPNLISSSNRASVDNSLNASFQGAIGGDEKNLHMNNVGGLYTKQNGADFTEEGNPKVDEEISANSSVRSEPEIPGIPTVFRKKVPRTVNEREGRYERDDLMEIRRQMIRDSKMKPPPVLSKDFVVDRKWLPDLWLKSLWRIEAMKAGAENEQEYFRKRMVDSFSPWNGPPPQQEGQNNNFLRRNSNKEWRSEAMNAGGENEGDSFKERLGPRAPWNGPQQQQQHYGQNNNFARRNSYR